MKNLPYIFGIALVLTACSETTTTETVEAAQPVEETVTAEVAYAGQELYKQHCGSCHGLKVVDDYSREQWNKIMPNMAKKAKLTPEETASVFNYVKWELKN